MCRPYLTFLYILLVLMFASAFSSCNNQEKNKKLLNRAVAELEDNPQKAKELLEAMPNLQSMTRADSMNYQLAYIDAKYRTLRDIRQDSVILKVCNYYDKQNNIEKGAYAHFYVASYYYQNKKYGKALESYLMADHKAMMSENLKLAGKSQNSIGYVFFAQGMADSAITHLNKALELYGSDSKIKTLKLQTLSSLDAAYHLKKDYQGVIRYCEKGLELAQELANQDRIAFFTQNIGAAYCDMGKLTQSKEYLYKALPITTNKADSVRLYLNLSRVYNKAHQLDSVSYYSELVEKNIADVTYKPTLKLIYTSLADYNEQIGNQKEFIHYTKLHNQINEEILQEQNTKQLLEANEKFALILRKEALAQKKMWVRATGIFLLLALAIIGLIARHKRKELKLKKELLQKQKKELKLENDLLHQQSVNLSTTLNTYEDIVKSRKEILEDVTFESIEKKKLDSLFDKIRKNVNYMFIEWSKSNLKDHPCYKKVMTSLTCEELRIMHLLHLEYSCESIAEMLGFGYNDEDMDYRIRMIKNKLLGAGVKSQEVNAIFAIDDSNSRITIS